MSISKASLESYRELLISRCYNTNLEFTVYELLGYRWGKLWEDSLWPSMDKVRLDHPAVNQREHPVISLERDIWEQCTGNDGATQKGRVARLAHLAQDGNTLFLVRE